MYIPQYLLHVSKYLNIFIVINFKKQQREIMQLKEQVS